MGLSTVVALAGMRSPVWLPLAIILSACVIAVPGALATWANRRRRARRTRR